MKEGKRESEIKKERKRETGIDTFDSMSYSMIAVLSDRFRLKSICFLYIY